MYHDLGGEIITVGSDATKLSFLLTDLMSWQICLITQGLITTQYLMKENLSSSDYDELRLILYACILSAPSTYICKI